MIFKILRPNKSAKYVVTKEPNISDIARMMDEIYGSTLAPDLSNIMTEYEIIVNCAVSCADIARANPIPRPFIAFLLTNQLKHSLEKIKHELLFFGYLENRP